MTNIRTFITLFATIPLIFALSTRFAHSATLEEEAEAWIREMFELAWNEGDQATIVTAADGL